MTTRRVICLFGGLTLFVGAGFAFFLQTGQITRPMLRNYGYFRWAHGKAPFESEYLWTFTRAPLFQQRFLGKPIESLRPYLPKLQAGVNYDPNSYRATGIRGIRTRYEGTRFEDFWFDGTQQEFGFCVLVVDGKIRDFVLVKG